MQDYNAVKPLIEEPLIVEPLIVDPLIMDPPKRGQYLIMDLCNVPRLALPIIIILGVYPVLMHTGNCVHRIHENAYGIISGAISKSYI